MKKSLLTILLAVCLIFPIAMFSGCDLSHKHYCDKFGVCRNCGENTATQLSLQNGVYSCASVPAKANDETYFSFVGNGTSNIKITISPSNISVTNFDLYTQTSSNLYLQRNNTVYVYEGEITQGTTYYISLKVSVATNLSVKIEPNGV